ncbi:hypothetical protein C8R47DRAFT_1194902 [Mycena vitilis]|nr:hypothetical protein C8R47DRAFT_1194902 [Mycena vitilis]
MFPKVAPVIEDGVGGDAFRKRDKIRAREGCRRGLNVRYSGLVEPEWSRIEEDGRTLLHVPKITPVIEDGVGGDAFRKRDKIRAREGCRRGLNVRYSGLVEPEWSRIEEDGRTLLHVPKITPVIEDGVGGDAFRKRDKIRAREGCRRGLNVRYSGLVEPEWSRIEEDRLTLVRGVAESGHEGDMGGV